MKVKEVCPELAEVICKRTRKKYEDREETCENCPLYIPKSQALCFKTIAYFIDKYGNKELKR